MKADLHCHSYYSDGALSPAAVVAEAKAAGAELLSLTDHDTMAGVDEAKAAAAKSRIALIPGVEISSHEQCDVHILGYNLNAGDPRFIKFEREMEEGRTARIFAMLEKLGNYGMKLSEEQVRSAARRGLSRIHVARAMVRAGYEPDVQSCFGKWLREGAPAYVPIDHIQPVRAIELITGCGGIAVLAHPVRLKMEESGVVRLTERLKEAGLAGIEAEYKNSDKGAVNFFRGLAKRLGLFVTAGGDFHDRGRQKIIPRELDSDALSALIG